MHWFLSDSLAPSSATLEYTNLQQLEEGLDSLSDDKLDDLHRELMQQQNSSSLNETTEIMLTDHLTLRSTTGINIENIGFQEGFRLPVVTGCGPTG